MFRFNISEEIILNIKNGKLKDKNYDREEYGFICEILEILNKQNIIVLYGLKDYLREDISIEIIYRFFYDNYKNHLDLSVFKINSIDELDELYLENVFQVFYLNDFFGQVSFNLCKFKRYVDNISKSQNKILILNVREFVKEEIFNEIHRKYFYNLNNHQENIKTHLCLRDSHTFDIKTLYEKYSQFSYVDKFVLLSIFINNIGDINIWIKSTIKYFLDKNIFRENEDLKGIILDSFKKLGRDFIVLGSNRRFSIKNLYIKDFLTREIIYEDKILKDLINNISCYESFKYIVDIIENLKINIDYTLEEYENNLKKFLDEVISISNSEFPIDELFYVMKIFKILNILDKDLIESLNTKIIYSKLSIEESIKYFFILKNSKEVLINNEIFNNKLLDLVYNYNSTRDFEFYNYSFKYFLFVSEVYDLYGNIDEEEIFDIKNHFERLINIILNNINSYFTLEYFTLSNEIKQCIKDLKILNEKYSFKIIFSKNIEDILIEIKDRLVELFDGVINFVPQNKQEYYTLTYFENEFERNKEFLEENFNMDLETILNKIQENISVFEA